MLMRRTGRDVQIAIEAVASKLELGALMEGLVRPAKAPPKEESVEEIQKELLDRFRPAIEAIWPSAAPMKDFDATLRAEGIATGVRYEAAEELGKVPPDMVLQSLRTRLSAPNLTLKAERTRPPRAPAKQKRP